MCVCVQRRNTQTHHDSFGVLSFRELACLRASRWQIEFGNICTCYSSVPGVVVVVVACVSVCMIRFLPDVRRG